MKTSNSKLFLFFGSLAFLLLLNNCKKDDDNNPGPGANSTITSLTVSDVGEAGNGTDLQVAFSKIADESQVNVGFP